MKKIIAMMTVALLMTACSSKLMTLKEGVSKETAVTFSNLPSLEELVTVDEETTTSEELAGDKYIITAVKGEKTEALELPVTFETVDVDGTLSVDLSQFYSNSDKLAKLSYEFNEDETVMTITDENGEEPYSFDVPVNVIYPSYTIADDITIDTYTGYDINDFITADESVEITSTLDEENSILKIILAKNNWSKTIDKEVIIIDSNPYPLHYYGYDTLGRTEEDLVIQEDLTFTKKTFPTNVTLTGYIEMDDNLNGKMYFNGFSRNDFYYIKFSEDKKDAKYTVSYPRMDGGYSSTIFELVED